MSKYMLKSQWNMKAVLTAVQYVGSVIQFTKVYASLNSNLAARNTDQESRTTQLGISALNCKKLLIWKKKRGTGNYI